MLDPMAANPKPLERDALHVQYFRTRDASTREELLVEYGGLARALARRFGDRGHGRDDLEQVAYIGLLKAIDGFDPTRGLRFTTYAIPTILGELKRHRRDQSWGIRPPRRLHDFYLEVEGSLDELTQQLGHRPTFDEVATHLGVPVEDVLEAAEAATTRRLPSLEAPNADGHSLSESISSTDRQFADVERSIVVAGLLAHLPRRDEQVVRMRFENDMTQIQIADALGCSQMQVCRALARSLDRLRALASPELACVD
ncbi:MAG: sigH [Acidimicrobiales bacterium]|jgi:RNA polymerase sigma-B factor|nr:sigH [Acidimicrobiales bacterium]